MSKADEFEALVKTHEDARLKAFRSNAKDDLEALHIAQKELIDCAVDNHALIARALRYAEMIESPSNDLRIEITNAVTNRAIYDLEDNLYHTPKLGDAALSVLREAVK